MMKDGLPIHGLRYGRVSLVSIEEPGADEDSWIYQVKFQAHGRTFERFFTISKVVEPEEKRRLMVRKIYDGAKSVDALGEFMSSRGAN